MKSIGISRLAGYQIYCEVENGKIIALSWSGKSGGIDPDFFVLPPREVAKRDLDFPFKKKELIEKSLPFRLGGLGGSLLEELSLAKKINGSHVDLFFGKKERLEVEAKEHDFLLPPLSALLAFATHFHSEATHLLFMDGKDLLLADIKKESQLVIPFEIKTESPPWQETLISLNLLQSEALLSIFKELPVEACLLPLGVAALLPKNIFNHKVVLTGSFQERILASAIGGALLHQRGPIFEGFDGACSKDFKRMTLLKKSIKRSLAFLFVSLFFIEAIFYQMQKKQEKKLSSLWRSAALLVTSKTKEQEGSCQELLDKLFLASKNKSLPLEQIVEEAISLKGSFKIRQEKDKIVVESGESSFLNELHEKFKNKKYNRFALERGEESLTFTPSKREKKGT